MKVLFENSRGIKREIASVDTQEQAYQEINKFCEDRNFTIHYTRRWNTDNGATKIDVGSHTEFFYIVKE